MFGRTVRIGPPRIDRLRIAPFPSVSSSAVEIMREDRREQNDACRLYAVRCSASNSLLFVQDLTRYLYTWYRSAPPALLFTLHDRCSHADKVSYFS